MTTIDTTATTDTTAITVVLPEAFDERWSRLPGIQIDGRRITINPAEYFFRFESSTWLVADWELVKSQLLNVEETTESAVEQLALNFIKAHAKSTSNAAQVLATAYEVYAYLFRDEHLAGLGLPQFTADHLRMLREAATLMALNKVELDGHISNVGPCWFFPAATSVVFDLDDETGGPPRPPAPAPDPRPAHPVPPVPGTRPTSRTPRPAHPKINRGAARNALTTRVRRNGSSGGCRFDGCLYVASDPTAQPWPPPRAARHLPCRRPLHS
ncbi:hypothetical protein [Streptomyces sp. NBC_01518]|uniref:hypothetical protein n=1 Tax=Streptomyces sp. NBC_01518 TaxID=2903891 RepID=UPI003864DB9F